MIEVKNLMKKYGEKILFDDLSATFEKGLVTCVLGASGVGKTTLLNAIAKLVDCDGEILPVERKCAYIFQEPRLLSAVTVLENLTLIGASKDEALRMLEEVELLEKADSYPSKLSGGEKQRVNVARAFLYDSPILLMDEPFSSLDTALKIRLCGVFAKLWRESAEKTCVFVTHDIEEAFMLADRILLLKDGKIALDMTLEKEEKPRPYGKESKEKERLLEALLKD